MTAQIATSGAVMTSQSSRNLTQPLAVILVSILWKKRVRLPCDDSISTIIRHIAALIQFPLRTFCRHCSTLTFPRRNLEWGWRSGRLDHRHPEVHTTINRRFWWGATVVIIITVAQPPQPHNFPPTNLRHKISLRLPTVQFHPHHLVVFETAPTHHLTVYLSVVALQVFPPTITSRLVASHLAASHLHPNNSNSRVVVTLHTFLHFHWILVPKTPCHGHSSGHNQNPYPLRQLHVRCRDLLPCRDTPPRPKYKTIFASAVPRSPRNLIRYRSWSKRVELDPTVLFHHWSSSSF